MLKDEKLYVAKVKNSLLLEVTKKQKKSNGIKIKKSHSQVRFQVLALDSLLGLFRLIVHWY